MNCYAQAGEQLHKSALSRDSRLSTFNLILNFDIAIDGSQL